MTFLAGDVFTADDANSILIEQGTYVPSLTATTTPPTLGSGSTVDGRYLLNPGTGQCVGDIFINFGTSGTAAGSGTYLVTLPFDILGFNSASIGQADIIGTFTLRDNSSTNASRHGVLTANDFSPGRARLDLLDGTNPSVTSAVPWAWTVSDAIVAHFDFIADV